MAKTHPISETTRFLGTAGPVAPPVRVWAGSGRNTGFSEKALSWQHGTLTRIILWYYLVFNLPWSLLLLRFSRTGPPGVLMNF